VVTKTPPSSHNHVTLFCQQEQKKKGVGLHNWGTLRMGFYRELEEPPLEEMLADPIVLLVMERDGIGPNDVRAAINEVLKRYDASPDCSPDTCNRIPPTRI
jgi:hypothetical protein